MKFREINISQEIKSSLEEIGFSDMTEVQEKAIPFALNGVDLIVRSQTGTGKTAAFGIAIVESALKGKRSLVLSPTRELAIQIFHDLKKIAKNSRIKISVVYGGESIERQATFLSKKPEIVVATPGRLIDHSNRGNINLDEFSIIVLDEADRMLDMGFIEDIQLILDSVESTEQIMLFSATLNREIMDIIGPYSASPEIIEIGEEEKAPTIEEEKIVINSPTKFKTLLSVLRENEGKAIIFLATRRAVEELGEKLKSRRIRTAYLHGGLKQRRRENIMKAFRRNEFRVLVATDVAARGLHIEDVSLVINYHEAGDEKTHIHRVGRTGRMGKKGKVITFVDGRRTSSY